MKKLIPFVLVLLVLGGGLAFAGAGRDSGSSATTGTTSTISTPIGQYPMNTTSTLRYWLVLHNNMAANFTNYADTYFGQELLKRTGVRVQFEHPAGSSTSVVETAFNLMIASGEDMPDIMEYNWVTVVGGPEKYIDDGVILRLNDVIDRYAPNLKAILTANPDYNRMVKTDNGSYYVFPFIR